MAIGSSPQHVTFGVRVPNSGPLVGATNIKAVARAAGRLGFDAVWVHDHIPWASEMVTHFSTGSIEACDGQEPGFYETITTVAYLAGICPHLDVGIAGLVLPLRDPRVLAKQLMTTQVLTGGRMVTALAIGNIPNDFDVMEVPFKRRGAITDDVLGALRAIYDHPRSSYQGDRAAFTDAEFYPKPDDARFWIAGNSPPAHRRIAEHADGWLPGGLTTERYAEDLAAVAAVLDTHGRSVTDLHRGVELYLCLAERTDDARAIAARSLEHRFGTVDAGLERNLIGDPGEVLGRIEAFRQAGVTHFELRILGHTIEAHIDMLELFATAVRPHVAVAAVR
jgi:alkanesulfonate monooxygenase SsuD/methylene tetrahydromethanopterin reductase-like flavin-dependent oxidoreductase (luciferase family)